MAKQIVFSDLHFGSPTCSLRKETINKKLLEFLREQGKIEQLILAGDILDANISSLTQAIEGRKDSGLYERVGFRKWLAYLFEQDSLDAVEIVYIPGNHDYIIWNILSTERAFVEPISEGKIPTNLPLVADTFKKPFIRGAAPQKMWDKFKVTYPDHEITANNKKVLITHGHYLDEKQTRFDDLEELIEEEGGDVEKAVRKFFIGTAQYQAVANSVSYMKGNRAFVDKLQNMIGGAIEDIHSLFDSISFLRHKPIDKEMLEAIEMYLLYFRKKKPDIFIFGHTHEAAYAKTSDFHRDRNKRLMPEVIEVWNIGCFLENTKKNLAGTFIIIDSEPADGDAVKLYDVDLNGNIAERM